MYIMGLNRKQRVYYGLKQKTKVNVFLQLDGEGKTCPSDSWKSLRDKLLLEKGLDHFHIVFSYIRISTVGTEKVKHALVTVGKPSDSWKT